MDGDLSSESGLARVRSHHGKAVHLRPYPHRGEQPSTGGHAHLRPICRRCQLVSWDECDGGTRRIVRNGSRVGSKALRFTEETTLFPHRRRLRKSYQTPRNFRMKTTTTMTPMT